MCRYRSARAESGLDERVGARDESAVDTCCLAQRSHVAMAWRIQREMLEDAASLFADTPKPCAFVEQRHAS